MVVRGAFCVGRILSVWCYYRCYMRFPHLGQRVGRSSYTQTATAVAQANEYSGFNWMSSQKTTNKGKGGFNVMQAAIDAAEKA